VTDALVLYAAGLQAPDVKTLVRLADGTVAPLAIERYLGPADETDELLLRGLGGPVLDVGCGPGRHLHALAKHGVFGLGVDLSTTAVGLARERGVQAIVGSIFDEVPGAGTWQAALLLDGNIGIDGTPERLLNRIRALLADRGEVLVELDRPSAPSGAMLARLETASGASGWFRWARVAADGIGAVARASGFTVAERWTHAERWFARLVMRPGGTA
jgi:SAM-dependent methyltransferase